MLAIEYATKGTMSDLIVAIRSLREPVAWTMLSKVFDGLAYMHRLSIAHRDLKLYNVRLLAFEIFFKFIQIIDSY